MTQPSSRPGESALKWAFWCILAYCFWTWTRSWHASILDRYEFRQLQTALSAFWMTKAGVHLDYLTPLFGPPWSVPMEFPTYQIIVAALSTTSHLPLEQCGRLVSILFFLATLPALSRLLEDAGLDQSQRRIALIVVLTSPVYLFYTRAVMIETTALCFSVWFLHLLQRSLHRSDWKLLPAVILLAQLAALTKITTFAVYALPAGLLTLAQLWRPVAPVSTMARTWARLVLHAGLPVGLALATCLAWIHHSDAVKDSNPFTGFLKSSELHTWNYGAWGLRFEPSFWHHLLENITRNQLSEGALAIVLLCATLATSKARSVALTALAGYLSGPLIFANLYHVHDYYYTANALLLTGAAGLLLASAWEHPLFRSGTRWMALGLLVAFQYLAFDSGYHFYYWKPAPPPPDLATIIRETVPPDGVVLIYGADWDPLLPYYSQRRALMVPGDRDAETKVLEDVLAQLPPRKIAAMILVGDKPRGRAEFIQERARRFGLWPQAFATSAAADLYLPVGQIPISARQLQGRHFTTARVEFAIATPPLPTDSKEQTFGPGDFPDANPGPLRARSRFGISSGHLDGLPVINAHAPSEITYQPPPGSTRLTAVAGLAPAAYAKPPPEGTDGVTVEIIEVLPDQLQHTLYRREMNPALHPADRGPQAIVLDHGTPFTGALILRVDPGPAGNFAYDQAYWTRIEFH